VSLRPLEGAELPLLGTWLAEPHVRRWWHHDPSPEAVERDFGAAVDGREPTELFAVLVEGRPVGLLQRYLISSYPEYEETLSVCDGVALEGAAGIDYLIGEAGLVGRGIGTAAIRLGTAGAFDDLGAQRVVVAVLQANRASWRALERAGYRLVWSVEIESDDPAEAGPNHVLVHDGSGRLADRCGTATGSP
jgi:aminoglycoside 6'-N-acetyltransferase